jgi:hypothetical protein
MIGFARLDEVPTVETAVSCEAADRIKQALQEMDLQWGSRQLDYRKVRSILTGEDSHDGAR